MNIYLAYITKTDGTRISIDKFDEMVAMAFDDQQLRIDMVEAGWTLDTEFGIDMDEAVAMSNARTTRWDELHKASAS